MNMMCHEVISAQQLQNTLQKISNLIEAADISPASGKLTISVTGVMRKTGNHRISTEYIVSRRVTLMTGLVTPGQQPER